MLYYEQNPERVEVYFAQHFERLTKLFTSRYDGPRKASITADLTKTGGVFGGQAPPDVPFEASFLDHEMFNAVVASERNNGSFEIVAYYRNGAANRAYNDPKRCANAAKLNTPCLYLDCSADLASVNNSSTNWTAEMHELCSHILEVQLDCRHMVALEKPTETNALLAHWLCEHTQAWPVGHSSGILKPGNALGFDWNEI